MINFGFITEGIETISIPCLPPLETNEFRYDDVQRQNYCHPNKKTFPGIDSWSLSVGLFQVTVGKFHQVNGALCDFEKIFFKGTVSFIVFSPITFLFVGAIFEAIFCGT